MYEEAKIRRFVRSLRCEREIQIIHIQRRPTAKHIEKALAAVRQHHTGLASLLRCDATDVNCSLRNLPIVQASKRQAKYDVVSCVTLLKDRYVAVSYKQLFSAVN